MSIRVIRAPIGYTLQGYGTTFSPLDATTYYFGSLFTIAPGTGAGTAKVYIPKAGRITRCVLFFNQSAGSAETSTMVIRLNNTSDTTISSAITNDAGVTTFSNTALNIPVVLGDYIEFKWTTPTWGTNPTNVRPVATLYIEP